MQLITYMHTFGIKFGDSQEDLIRVKGSSIYTSQDRLDPVFNKGEDVSPCESVQRTSTCFRCYSSNQKLHDNNQQEHPDLIPYTLKKPKRPLSSHSFD